MHWGHTITSQKKRKPLQREQVPWILTQNQQKEHHMFLRSQEVQLLPRAKLCRRIPCPAPPPVLVKTYLPVPCNRLHYIHLQDLLRVLLFHCLCILFQRLIAAQTVSCFKDTFYHTYQNSCMMLYFQLNIISIIQIIIMYFVYVYRYINKFKR